MTKHKQVHKVCNTTQVFVQVEIYTRPIKTLPTNLKLIDKLLFIHFLDNKKKYLVHFTTEQIPYLVSTD